MILSAAVVDRHRLILGTDDGIYLSDVCNNTIEKIMDSKLVKASAFKA